MQDRTCIVTREAGSADGMIRFVVDPEGRVVADLKRKLPGRGCWVTATRDNVDLAVKRKLFKRAFKAEVTASAELGAEVDALLADQLIGMMSLARKAGQFVSGSTKVDQSVRSGAAIAVFHALDAAADGVRKIDQARKALAFMREDEAEIPSFRLFSADEMQRALGDAALMHAAALAGQAGEGVVKRAIWLDRYRHGRHHDASAG